MVEGGEIPGETAELAQCALAADYYGLLLFEYVAKLRRIRKQFGDDAARLEIELALQLRERKLKAKVEMLEAGRKAGG